MLRKLLAAAAIAATIGLAACESGPTPYQPGGGSERGYSESRIENDRWRISFKGNSMTDRETAAMQGVHRSGAEHARRRAHRPSGVQRTRLHAFHARVVALQIDTSESPQSHCS